MLRKTLTLAAVTAATLAAAASASAQEYQIGIVQTLTGPAAFVGVPIKDGAMIAIEEINRRQLLGPGKTLKGVVQDDGFDRGQAITQIKRFAADDNVLAVFGPTSGPIALAGGAAARDGKIIAYATTNSLEYTGISPYNFALTQPPPVTIQVLFDYVKDVLKVKNCVTVGIHDNEAYVAISRFFQAKLAETGIKNAGFEPIRTTETDFSALATKVASMADIDCAFVNALPAIGANFISQLKQAGLRPGIKIFGGNTFATTDFIKTGGQAVEGVYLIADWLPGGSNDEGKKFTELYKAKHNMEPDNWAPIGYSGMMVLANAIKNAGDKPTRDSVRDALAKTKDVPVIIGKGTYSFKDDRSPYYGMNVMVVKDGKFAKAPN